MKRAPVVAHYYQDYHESREERGVQRSRYIEGYEVLRLLPREEELGSFEALIAAAAALARVARAPSAPLSGIVSARRGI